MSNRRFEGVPRGRALSGSRAISKCLFDTPAKAETVAGLDRKEIWSGAFDDAERDFLFWRGCGHRGVRIRSIFSERTTLPIPDQRYRRWAKAGAGNKT